MLARIFVAATLVAALANAFYVPQIGDMSSASVVVTVYNNPGCQSFKTNYSFPIGQCTHGQMYKCQSNSQLNCAQVVGYGTDSTCTTPSGTQHKQVCGACQVVPTANGGSSTGYLLSGCSTGSFTLKYNCSASCGTCATTQTFSAGQCVLSPYDGQYFKLTSSGKCGTIIKQKLYNSVNCGGGVKMMDYIVANSCNSGSGHSNIFTCTN